jgi:cytochrome c
VKVFYTAGLAVGATMVVMSAAHAAKGDRARGQRSCGACAACHSLQPDRNMTGPSLAGLWDRKAGTLPSFSRYSPALMSSGIVWTGATLDKWLADPQQLFPGNTMTFPGIEDTRVRVDLLAFSKTRHSRDTRRPQWRSGVER